MAVGGDVNVAPMRPSADSVIRDLRDRVDGLERAPVDPVGPHRVVVGASGSTMGYSQPQTPPWRPWTAVTFTDLWLETTDATTGLIVEMFVNGTSMASVEMGTSEQTGRETFGPMTVDVFDRVDFRVTDDGDGYSVWKGLCVQALGTAAHPVSAWLTFIEAGGED